MAQGLLKKLT